MNCGFIEAVSISLRKGEPKTNVPRVKFIASWGIESDAHAGEHHRQVSLLAFESILKMRSLGVDVNPGDFAENITTKELNVVSLRIGDQLTIGDVVLEVTQIGKECHTRCAIFQAAGYCIMPREGIFARVLRGGSVEPGMRIVVSYDVTPYIFKPIRTVLKKR